MADLEITIRRGSCSLKSWQYCSQCHTQWAGELGCLHFDPIGDDGKRVIPFGDCIHASYTYIEKGISTNNYQVEPFEGEYFDKWAEVTIGRKKYECIEVKIDGKTVFPYREG